MGILPNKTPKPSLPFTMMHVFSADIEYVSFGDVEKSLNGLLANPLSAVEARMVVPFSR